MANMEALWTVRFGRPETPPGQMQGGVIVLETGRMFGGDSLYAYTGTFEPSAEGFVGNLEVIRHNHVPGYGSIYGKNEQRFTAKVIAKRTDEQTIDGRVERQGEIPLKLQMRWLAPLP